MAKRRAGAAHAKSCRDLLVLVQQNGKLVEREALMSAIWPDTYVEDGQPEFQRFNAAQGLGTNQAGEQYIQLFPDMLPV